MRKQIHATIAKSAKGENDMTREEYVAKAIEYKHDGYNCCQSVINAFADVLDADTDTLNKLASGFAVGMGGMEATCGALVGAVAVAGLMMKGRGTTAASRQMHNLFTKKCGASLCKDLKGRDTGVMLCSCDDCVKNAVLSLCEILDI